MKKIVSFSILVLCLAGCEQQPEVNSNADWKILDIQTDIDLHEVFFVNPNVGFVAGTAPYEVETHSTIDVSESAILYAQEVHVITNSSPYYTRTLQITPQTPVPSFFKTTDGGITWKNVSTPFVATVTDIFFIDEFYGFVATREEGVYKTKDGGITWEKVIANFMFIGRGMLQVLEDPFSKVYFRNKMEGFAFNDEKNIVVKTVDGGESWELISSFVFDFGRTVEVQNMVFKTNSPIGYGFSILGGCCGMGKLFKTENGGGTWDEINYSIHNGAGTFYVDLVKDFTFVNESTGFLTDGWNTYMTNDGGANWERKNIENKVKGRQVTPEKIFSLNENEVYILDGSVEEHNMLGEPYELILNKCKVYYSNNSGVDYSEMSMQHQQASIKNWFFLEEAGFLVGENGLILKYQRK